MKNKINTCLKYQNIYFSKLRMIPLFNYLKSNKILKQALFNCYLLII
jgi:hypothetical protein